MGRMRVSVAVFLALGGVSCVPVTSVFPFFFEKDVFVDERLAGEWSPCPDSEARESEVSASIVHVLKRKNDSRAYEMVAECRPGEHADCADFRRADTSSSITVTLFALGGHQYLDVAGRAGNDPFFSAGGWTMSATHSLFRVALGDDRMHLAFLDQEKVKKAIGEGNLRIAHRSESEDDLLLTASTNDLRRMVLRSADELGLVEDLDDYCRVSPSGADGSSVKERGLNRRKTADAAGRRSGSRSARGR